MLGLSGVARSWHQQPVAFMLPCGDHRWRTGARVSQLQTCSVWELSGVARSWHQQPVTIMLPCGVHQWRTGFPVATCSVWELLGVARLWHQHPVTFILHCGDHRWHTGVSVRKEVDKAVQAFPVLDLEHFISSSHGVEKTEVLFGQQLGGK